MKYFKVIFCLLLSWTSVAQNNCDTTFYVKDQRTYTFKLQDNPCQLLYLDTVFDSFPHGIEVHVLNNTEDTIKIPRYNPSDHAIMWVPKVRQTIIPPDSVFVVQCLYPHLRPGPFHNTITINYIQNQENKYARIKTRGFAIINGERPWLNAKESQNVNNGKGVSETIKPPKEYKGKDLAVVNKVQVTEIDTALYTTRSASFPGGDSAFINFIDSNFDQALVDKMGMSGTVYATFIVNIDGSLSNIEIFNPLHYQLGNELKRVLKLSPKWVCAICRKEFLLPLDSPRNEYCIEKVSIPCRVAPSNNKK